MERKMQKVLFCVAALVIATNLSQAQQANITWIPNTSVSIEGSCVSANGSVVAVQGYNGVAYKWENGAITSLGTGTPKAVSADGSTVVGYTVATASRWQNGQSEPLGFLGAGPYGYNSNAFACSANGDVVVGKSSSSYYTYGEAFIWKDGEMTGLGGLINPTDSLYPYSQATDISNDGVVVVGHSGRWSYERQAFRWENGAMAGLGYLPGLNSSEALAISGNGQVIVGLSYSLSTLNNQVFRWENGVMVGLGNGIATGASYDGSVIVGWMPSGDDYTQYNAPFIWDAQHGMRNLENMLRNDYNLDLGSYRLIRALGISDDGKTIIGYGYGPDSSGPWSTSPNNYEEAFIVTIPEPATIGLLALGGLLLRKRRA
jgi:probable HAF family extracellular repeat protein